MNGPHQQMDLWRCSETSVLRIIGQKQKILLGLTKIQNTRKAAKPHDIGGGGSKRVSGRRSFFSSVSLHFSGPVPSLDLSHSTLFPAATGDRGRGGEGLEVGSVSHSDSTVRLSQTMSIKCQYTDDMFGSAEKSNEHVMTLHHHVHHIELTK